MRLQAAKHKTEDVYQRFLHFMQSLPSTNSFSHANYYKTYTSKRNLSFVKQDPSKACDPVSDTCSPSLGSRSSRSTVSSVDWSLCVFCQKKRKENIGAARISSMFVLMMLVKRLKILQRTGVTMP